MILRQLFDFDTYTYTYLIGDKNSGSAALIDPVIGNVDSYIQLLDELDLELTIALDTHIHADHITALGKLREKTGAKTYLSNPGYASCADFALEDKAKISVGSLTIEALHTPGHTDDSYTFLVRENNQTYVFTGDTLLIRGTGRTDFQNGNAQDLFHSLHEKLLKLPNDTIVYPGHDYKGWTRSTIAEERAHNPRLRLKTCEEFVEHMNNLDLPRPKYMDIAIPANLGCGKNKNQETL